MIIYILLSSDPIRETATIFSATFAFVQELALSTVGLRQTLVFPKTVNNRASVYAIFMPLISLLRIKYFIRGQVRKELSHRELCNIMPALEKLFG